jgi:hypothetical protein
MKPRHASFINIFGVLLVCLAGQGGLCGVNANQPDWVSGLGRSALFPESRYLTGFGVSSAADEGSIGRAVEEAKSNAASALAEGMKVRVQVKVTSGTMANSRESKSGKSKEFRDDYWSQIVSTSDVDVEGMGFEVYRQSARQPVYALAWIDKDVVRKHYRQELASRLQLASELNNRVDGMSAQGDIVGARELSEESQNILDQIDGITAMLELLGDAPDVKALAAEKANVLGRIQDSEANSGPLRLLLWTSMGIDGVTLLSGESMAIFAHVNKPCFLHLVCRLSVGVWTVPDVRYWNLRLDETKAGKDYVLPDSFFATRPAGTDTLVAAVSQERWRECDFVRQLISGESYLVVAPSCVPPHALSKRGTPDSSSVKSIAVTTKR